jgi:hypothetical protein
MPSDGSQLSMEQHMTLAEKDPEFLTLWTGTADAAVEAAVLDGTWGDAPPAPPTQEQQSAARVQEILAAMPNPYGQLGSYDAAGNYTEPVQPNLTLALELEALDPAMASQLKAAAAPPAAQAGMTAEQAAWVNSEMARLRVEAMNQAFVATTPMGAA